MFLHPTSHVHAIQPTKGVTIFDVAEIFAESFGIDPCIRMKPCRMYLVIELTCA